MTKKQKPTNKEMKIELTELALNSQGKKDGSSVLDKHLETQLFTRVGK